jgi:hypothetical protein
MLNYYHVQRGYWVQTILAIPLLAMFITRSQLSSGFWIALVIVFLVGGSFHMLTVTVTHHFIQVQFSLMFIRKRIWFNKIAGLDIVRVPWYWGIGIRWTSEGVLYNVAPGRAVAVRLRSGRSFLIGSDEPEKLAEAIESAVGLKRQLEKT